MRERCCGCRRKPDGFVCFIYAGGGGYRLRNYCRRCAPKKAALFPFKQLPLVPRAVLSMLA